MTDRTRRVHPAANGGVGGEDRDADRWPAGRGRSGRTGLVCCERLPSAHAVVDRVGGGRTGAGEPVETDGGQQLVTVHLLAGPLVELLGDPGELTDRRVVQRVPQGLWPGLLDGQVAGAVVQEVVEPLGAGAVGRVDGVRVDRRVER